MGIIDAHTILQSSKNQQTTMNKKDIYGQHKMNLKTDIQIIFV